MTNEEPLLKSVWGCGGTDPFSLNIGAGLVEWLASPLGLIISG